MCSSDLDVGGQPPVDTVFIFPLALLQGRQIVLQRLGAGHKTHSFRWLTASIVSNAAVGCQYLGEISLVWIAEKRACRARSFDALPSRGRRDGGGAENQPNKNQSSIEKDNVATSKQLLRALGEVAQPVTQGIPSRGPEFNSQHPHGS